MTEYELDPGTDTALVPGSGRGLESDDVVANSL